MHRHLGTLGLIPSTHLPVTTCPLLLFPSQRLVNLQILSPWLVPSGAPVWVLLPSSNCLFARIQQAFTSGCFFHPRVHLSSTPSLSIFTEQRGQTGHRECLKAKATVVSSDPGEQLEESQRWLESKPKAAENKQKSNCITTCKGRASLQLRGSLREVSPED